MGPQQTIIIMAVSSVDLSQYQAQVDATRKKFLSKYDGNILDDTYDERDVDWVNESDAFIRSVLGNHKVAGNVEKAVDSLNDILLFRAKWEINNLTEDKLHPELIQKNGVYFHGTDHKGLKILQFRVCKQKKGHLVKEGKQLILYHMNKHYRENPDQQIVTLYDFIDAGVGNMDLDISKFIIQILSDYFPSMDAEQSKNTLFVKRSTIDKYLDKSMLLPHQQKEE